MSKLLLGAGADSNVKDHDENTPRLQASRSRGPGSHYIAKLLLHAGTFVNVKNRNKRSPLHIAAFCGTSVMVQVLLDAGADANIKDQNETTPLLEAAKTDISISLNIVKLLLHYTAVLIYLMNEFWNC